MDLICSSAYFTSAILYVAIGSDYVVINNMENYVPLEEETYIYCEALGHSELDLNIRGGILILDESKLKKDTKT